MSALLKPAATPATMTSKELADLTEKRHDNVKRLIDNLSDQGVISHPQIEDGIKAANGVVEKLYRVGKRDSYVIVAQLSPEFTARLVDRWQELETAAAPAVELSRLQILQLAMDAEQGRIKAEAERDQAIATKALIGSKREATAMATAAKYKRESEIYREELGFNESHATVKAVEKVTGTDFGKKWRDLKAWCSANGQSPKSVPDKLYGEVKAWPAGAWMATFGVDIRSLFGGHSQGATH